MSRSTDSLSSSSSSSENSSDSSAGPDTPLRAASPQFKLSDMASLTLHSPNTQIVGTPFATHCDSAPFEYPFPASPPAAITQSPPSCSSRPPSPAVVLVPLPPPVFAPSAILSDPTTTLALSLSMGVPTSSSSSSASASPTTSDVSATALLHHPSKMRMATAPVPPGLIKRRRERAANCNGAMATSDAVLPTSGRQPSGSSCGTTSAI